MGLTNEETKKYLEFCEFSDKNVVIELMDGDKFSGKLIDIENPFDVEPEYPMFIIEENPSANYLTGLYLNEIKEIKLA